MSTEQQKEFVLFRRKDGNHGIVSSRAFFLKNRDEKARQFLECVEIAQSDNYDELQEQINALVSGKGKTKPVEEPKETVGVDAPTAEEIEALQLKMAQDGFKKTTLTKREKSVLKFIEEGGEDE